MAEPWHSHLPPVDDGDPTWSDTDGESNSSMEMEVDGDEPVRDEGPVTRSTERQAPEAVPEISAPPRGHRSRGVRGGDQSAAADGMWQAKGLQDASYSPAELKELQTKHFYLAPEARRRSAKIQTQLAEPPRLRVDGDHRLYYQVVNDNKSYKSRPESGSAQASEWCGDGDLAWNRLPQPQPETMALGDQAGVNRVQLVGNPEPREDQSSRTRRAERPSERTGAMGPQNIGGRRGQASQTFPALNPFPSTQTLTQQTLHEPSPRVRRRQGTEAALAAHSSQNGSTRRPQENAEHYWPDESSNMASNMATFGGTAQTFMPASNSVQATQQLQHQLRASPRQAQMSQGREAAFAPRTSHSGSTRRPNADAEYYWPNGSSIWRREAAFAPRTSHSGSTRRPNADAEYYWPNGSSNMASNMATFGGTAQTFMPASNSVQATQQLQHQLRAPPQQSQGWEAAFAPRTSHSGSTRRPQENVVHYWPNGSSNMASNMGTFGDTAQTFMPAWTQMGPGGAQSAHESYSQTSNEAQYDSQPQWRRPEPIERNFLDTGMGMGYGRG
ncbi:hypothetical protein AURDEDRAFT_121870 [Auricularia subglabra TFB-10046 SS5]|nr:hypothetical protein AURDEDRAFT_121870 [Auricularia subglabra TFB-10046 SS5]